MEFRLLKTRLIIIISPYNLYFFCESSEGWLYSTYHGVELHCGVNYNIKKTKM
jgi:hypothetical protein